MTARVLPRHSLKTRITLATLLIFLLSLAALSYFNSRMLREDMEHLLGEQQLAAAALVAAQVNRELEIRLKALETLAGSAGQPFLDGPKALQSFIEARLMLPTLFSVGVFATDRHGTPIRSVRAGADRRRLRRPRLHRSCPRTGPGDDRTAGHGQDGQSLRSGHDGADP